MKTEPSDVSDFYHQLALLVRSNLPLPESLRQLGLHFPKPEFSRAILDISERTARGEKFSEAIKGYPRFLHALHARLISAGEASGTLSETLFAVARFARFWNLVAMRARDIAAYPLLTLNIAGMIVCFVSVTVIPAFARVYADLYGGAYYSAYLPYFSRVVFGIGMAIYRHWPLVFLLCAVFLVLSVWLFLPGMAPHRTLLALLNVMPGSARIVHSLDSARLCSLLSLFMSRRMPLHEALAFAVELVERRSLRNALKNAARRVEAGATAEEAFRDERGMDKLIVLTVMNTPEDELPDELARLGELFEHRVTLSVKSASRMWAIIAFVATALVVGMVVVAMFYPMYTIVSCMAR